MRCSLLPSGLPRLLPPYEHELRPRGDESHARPIIFDGWTRAQHIAVLRLDPHGAVALYYNAFGRRVNLHATTFFLDGSQERSRQLRRATDAHLRLALARQKRRNVVAKTLCAKIDLAQTIKKEQSSLDKRVLKLAQDKFLRRELARL